MSKVKLRNGDDHPEAAGKHLLDAKALISLQRADGAAYLSGYVVECAIKTLLLLEVGWQPGHKTPWERGAVGHDLNDLASKLAALSTVATSKTARYIGVETSKVSASAIAGWNPQMRYRPEAVALPDSQAWVQIAEAVYRETVEKMRIDGVL